MRNAASLAMAAALVGAAAPAIAHGRADAPDSACQPFLEGESLEGWHVELSRHAPGENPLGPSAWRTAC